MERWICTRTCNGLLLPVLQVDVNFLVGGLEHVLFSHILGIIIPIDFHIFQRGGPTTNQFWWDDLNKNNNS